MFENWSIFDVFFIFWTTTYVSYSNPSGGMTVTECQYASLRKKLWLCFFLNF